MNSVEWRRSHAWGNMGTVRVEPLAVGSRVHTNKTAGIPEIYFRCLTNVIEMFPQLHLRNDWLWKINGRSKVYMANRSRRHGFQENAASHVEWKKKNCKRAVNF